MHFEILVEDQSGEKALEILMPKIIGDQHTFQIHSYRGSGRIPKNLKSRTDASKRVLLDRLPKLLNGYGRTIANYPTNFPAVVIVVCDLDRRCLKEFREELFAILNSYQNDSICGTWELLANVVFPGGLSALKEKGRRAVGREKSAWAQKITPHMNINKNASPSFCYFRDKIRELI